MQNKKNELKYRSYKFALVIVKLISGLEKNKIAGIIGSQVLRSGTSIGANIVEAQSGSSKKDFVNFYLHALKSANETKFWLCLMRDSKIGTSSEVEKILSEAVEIANILGKSILTMKGK